MNQKKDDFFKLWQLLTSEIDPALIIAGINFAQEHQQTPPQLRHRWQDKVILTEISENASVLDLGCGYGEFLSSLVEAKKVMVQGVEINPEAVMACMEAGIPIINADLDDGLSDFADQSFDFVILESTLQTLKNPLSVLSEMLRVGKQVVVSFPNFAYWRVRIDLAIRGQMPITPGLPYTWYNTPNIHNLTIKDFLNWTSQQKAIINKGFILEEGLVRPQSESDNLLAEEALFFLKRQ